MTSKDHYLHRILTLLKTPKMSLIDVEKLSVEDALKELYLFDAYSVKEISAQIEEKFPRLENNILSFLENNNLIEKIRFGGVDYYRLSNSYYSNKKLEIQKIVCAL